MEQPRAACPWELRPVQIRARSWAWAALLSVAVVLTGSCEKEAARLGRQEGEVKGLKAQLEASSRIIADLNKQLDAHKRDADLRLAEYRAEADRLTGIIKERERMVDDLRQRCPEDVRRAQEQCDREKLELRQTYDETKRLAEELHRKEVGQLQTKITDLTERTTALERNLLTAEEQRDNFGEKARVEPGRREAEFRARSWISGAEIVVGALLVLFAAPGWFLWLHARRQLREVSLAHLRALQYAPVHGFREIIATEVVDGDAH